MSIWDGLEPQLYLSPEKDTKGVEEITHNRIDENSGNTNI